MVAHKFPFPAGSPEDEIAFLIQFVNGDWEVFTSDGMTEAFYHVHTNEGRPLTPDFVAQLRNEARSYLLGVTKRRTVRIKPQIVRETDAGQYTAIEGDFTGRVRLAVRHVIRSRRALRVCDLCEDFFFPRGREPYCERCRYGRIARGLELEQAQERSRRFRERHSARRSAERARLEQRRDELIAQLLKSPNNVDRIRLARTDKRLTLLERHNYGTPPPPPVAHYEGVVMIGGGKACDVQLGTASSSPPVVPDTIECEPIIVTFSGTYADLLKQYRTARLKGQRFIA
jgi:hypothetical protein